MMNAMYEVPSDEDAVECIITEEAAKGNAEPILVTKDDERREISSESKRAAFWHPLFDNKSVTEDICE